MTEQLSPMMQHYMEKKEEYKDCILFYRLGDFYEMFFDDAVTVSRELELTLTGRDCGEGQRAPMCGVPYHSAQTYIGRLIALGHKVAICEQTEDPATAKGLVKREVIRVVTPGTLIESDLLSESMNNYLAALYVDDDAVGLAFTDVSTAQVSATCFKKDEAAGQAILSEFAVFSPKEVITNISVSEFPQVGTYLKERSVMVNVLLDKKFFGKVESTAAAGVILGNNSVPDGNDAAVIAIGASATYILATQMADISYIKDVTIYQSSQFLEMDVSTRRNLELCETMLTKEKRGSLLWVLDKTSTAMGARLLRYWLEHPLTNAARICERQTAVAELNSNFMLREKLRECFADVLDLERLMTRIVYGSAGGRELRSVCQTLAVLPEVHSLLASSGCDALRLLSERFDPLEDIFVLIDSSISENPPFTVKEGGVIRDGYNPKIDELRSIMSGAEDWIKKIEAEERERTGIKNLRIGNNRVFGYYIEVTKSFTDRVPEGYIRKQTLANCERYITQELKDTESTIIGASDKVKSLEYEVFCAVRDAVSAAGSRIRAAAAALAEADVYVSLAEAAAQNNYVCPEIDYSDEIDIRDGRHPVVERFVKDAYFVPNDTRLNTSDCRMMLITGPNMAGKSTYMRQTALIVLMAQTGSFVPASSARIGIVDKLFTRVGASDDLASGQSTFMLEMQEVAAIVKKATKRSLIIYDEIGRGTSTFDGMSIARAVAEYTASKKLGAKTLFATHYHELCALEEDLPGVVNFNVAVKKRGDDLTFLRKIIRGPVDESYGVQVAALAGIPKEIVKRAKEILSGFENEKCVTHVAKTDNSGGVTNLTFADAAADKIRDELKRIDINTLTPIEAMNLIFKWKNELM